MTIQIYPDFANTWNQMTSTQQQNYINDAIERTHALMYNQNIAFYGLNAPSYEKLSVSDKAQVRLLNIKYFHELTPVFLAMRKKMLGK